MNFGVYANPTRDVGLKGTRILAAALKQAGADVSYDPDTAAALGLSDYQDAHDCDILFVIGGDGTILRAVHRYVDRGVKFVGINYGHLGFMSEIGLSELDGFLQAAAADELFMDRRMMLEAQFPDGELMLALNEFVFTGVERAKSVQLDLLIDGALAQKYNGDGLIVATATGSTAYSLSAGGPVIAPDVACILVTPLCAHSLYARSIVAGPDGLITVRPVSEELYASPDGRPGRTLRRGEAALIRRAPVQAQFVRLAPDAFFPTLEAKLAQWGDRKQ